VLNGILFISDLDLLSKIADIANPNCTFCNETFYCTIWKSFRNDIICNIFSKLSSWRYLLLGEVIIGFMREGMDLVNYVLLLGKKYLWDCRRNVNKPSIAYFIQILKNKYNIEKLIPSPPKKKEKKKKKKRKKEESIFQN